MAAITVVSLLLFCTIALQSKVVSGQTCKFCSAGEIYVDSTGGYRNILVSIHDNVTYHADLVGKVEAYLHELSQSLFVATRHVRARYIADVTILVPSHWPSDPSYTTATTENPNFSAFVVRTTEKTWKHNPHTVRVSTGCGIQGVEGDYITLPDQYLLDPNLAAMFGHIGKAMVHEWAHYRYGVFDESGDEDGGILVSCAEENPSRCDTSITGIFISSPLPGYCLFLPNVVGQTAESSLMYAPYLDSVYTFCDDAEHNSLASNKHNSQCGQRSVWSVLRDHDDFSSSIPAAVSAPPIQFRRVQENIQRIVIIMDVSGSMAGDPLLHMQKDVEDFIRSLAATTKSTGIPVMVGMVEFASAAQTDHALVVLTDQTANTLINAIPTVASGGTCIGCGILEGIELLQLYGGCGKRGLLYVFTDGIEGTAPPTISDVRDEVCACNATVYGLIITNVANDHPLKELANDTCGSTCIYDANQTITMYECLMDATSDLSPHLIPVQIAGYVTQRPPQTDLSDSIVIDEKLSPRVTFRFSWPSSQALQYNIRRSTLREKDSFVFDSDSVKKSVANRCDQITASVTTPEGVTIQQGSPGYTKDALSIEIVASSGQYGSWDYTIYNPSAYTCDVRVTIESTAAKSSEVVEMTFQVPKTEVILNPNNPPEENSIPLYVTLKEGSLPVGNARVTAQITKGSSLWVIDMLDNGAGADFRLNDGTYSRYFTEFNGDGVYSIRFLAQGVAGEVTLIHDERSYGSGAPPLPDYRVHMSSYSEPTGAFERSAPGGYVQISGYASLPPDMYPPSKIVDLSATPAPIQAYNATVNLTWTATGANLDKGQASYYDLRISKNATELSTAFDTAAIITASMVLIGDLTTPLEAGLRENYVLGLAGTAFGDINTPYYVAVRAVNSDSIASTTSNIETFTFAPPPPCPPEEGGC